MPKAEEARTSRRALMPAVRRVRCTARSSQTADASSTRPTITRSDRHRSAGQPYRVAFLQAAHPIEQPAPTPQFGRCAILDDPAVLQDDEPVELRHRG